MALFSRFQSEKGSGWPKKEESWVGRVTYDYDLRYFIEMNGAYNGSEKFGPDYRFDFFPSVAAGWLISNESFINDNLPWVDNLKIRYSYGLVGNDRVSTPRWPHETIWGTYGLAREEAAYYGYPSPYDRYIRYAEGTPGNPLLRWEKATKQNLGLDISILKNKIAFSADFFHEYRDDMLLGAGARANNVAPIFGQNVPAANVGIAKSKGAELELVLRHSIKNKFHFWVSGNWAVARSEVIYKESPELMPDYQKPEGKPVGQTFSSLSTGFVETWDDLYCVSGAQDEDNRSRIMPGDLIMLDYNGNGSYNGTYDKVPYNYPTYPQNNYGLAVGGNYKSFQFNVRFLGAYNTTRRISANLFYTDNLYVPEHMIGDTWSPEYGNENPTYPAFALAAKKYIPTGTYSEFDGSFFRLQSVQISYTLPKNFTSKMKMEKVKLFVNGRNLFLWTLMPNDGVGLDHSGKNYPTKKQVNFGLNILF